MTEIKVGKIYQKTDEFDKIYYKIVYILDEDFCCCEILKNNDDYTEYHVVYISKFNDMYEIDKVPPIKEKNVYFYYLYVSKDSLIDLNKGECVLVSYDKSKIKNYTCFADVQKYKDVELNFNWDTKKWE